MPEHMIVPVEWKAVSGGPGELEGYVSVFGNVDQRGDVVLPGAFANTLRYWSKQAQPMPLIADHDLSSEGVIGSVHNAREDTTGLRVKARFSADRKAQSIRTKMIEGHLRGMSFTYEAVKHHLGTVAGKSVRYLQEVKIFEATVTPFPMNTLAVGSAKAAMTSASINDLPDSAFAYIQPGGTKDAEGKTTPRSLRHFPDRTCLKRPRGRVEGKSVRYLQEVKIFEATVTPFPMNTLAVGSAKAAMTSASINDLPDSAFAYIQPGGTKDAEGKTTPRSLRHFPVHDAAHVRDALGRAPQ